jgi:uncharacterized protein (UPF0264 family)
MLPIDQFDRPGLLVSVRDAREALDALAGGADVIDVKEPNRGSLGAADSATIDAIVRAVNGRAPVTAAAGELFDFSTTPRSAVPRGVSLVKIGLAGCRLIPEWQSRWRDAFASLIPHSEPARHAVAVAYADWRAADAPPPRDILQAAVQYGCPALLIDTWDKSRSSLFDHWPPIDLLPFIQTARSQGLMVVLAGSLTAESVSDAARLQPDLVAVRSAACNAGRGGTVSRNRVHALQQSIVAARASCHSESSPKNLVETLKASHWQKFS